jgi:hypothetical protein
MVQARKLVILAGAAAAALAVLRHGRHATRGHQVPGGILIDDAVVYDTLSRLLLGPFLVRIAADVAAVAPDGARVLEVGCGPGHRLGRVPRPGARALIWDFRPGVRSRLIGPALRAGRAITRIRENQVAASPPTKLAKPYRAGGSLRDREADEGGGRAKPSAHQQGARYRPAQPKDHHQGSGGDGQGHRPQAGQLRQLQPQRPPTHRLAGGKQGVDGEVEGQEEDEQKARDEGDPGGQQCPHEVPLRPGAPPPSAPVPRRSHPPLWARTGTSELDGQRYGDRSDASGLADPLGVEVAFLGVEVTGGGEHVSHHHALVTSCWVGWHRPGGAAASGRGRLQGC